MFFIYWIMSCLICSSWYNYDLFIARKEEYEDRIADITWETGIARKEIIEISQWITLILAPALLPFKIFCRIYESIIGKKFL